MSGFLCTYCRAAMCEDCVSIADEHQYLYEQRKMALARAEYKYESLEKEIAKVRRELEMYKEVSKAGVGDIISAWIDKEIEQLLE